MKALLFIMVAFISMNSCAQTDTLFWFGAPEVIQNSNWDRPIVLRITSYALPTQVHISQPAGTNGLDTTLSLAPNTLSTLDLTPWILDVENNIPDTVLQRGLKIRSDNDISIYYEVVSGFCNCNPEIFTLKGMSGLGNAFWISGQTIVNNNAGVSPNNESIIITSTADATEVRIIPSHDIVGHLANDTVMVVLDEGETFVAMALSSNATLGLAGTYVESDHPISITLINDALRNTSFGTCTDAGGDQLVPISTIGNEYIAINGFLDGPGDQLFILATQDSTIVSKDGLIADTLMMGVTRQYPVGDSSIYISSTHPVYALQLSGFGCEMGLAQLPQIQCTGSEELSIARSTTEPFFVNLLVPTGGESSFTIDGIPGLIQSDDFHLVPGTNGAWSAGQVVINSSILPVDSSISIANGIQPFHLGVIHGGSITGTRFGYFSDFTCPSITTSIDGYHSNTINVYPNPAKDAIFIKSEDKITLLEVYDISGKRVKHILYPQRNSIDISDLENGMYIISINTTAGERTSLKFLKE